MDEDANVNVSVEIDDRHVLSVAAAVLAAGMLAAQPKAGLDDAAALFFGIRGKLIEGMSDSERGGLPLHLVREAYHREARRAKKAGA
jgi:hypothetical protein